MFLLSFDGVRDLFERIFFFDVCTIRSTRNEEANVAIKSSILRAGVAASAVLLVGANLLAQEGGPPGAPAAATSLPEALKVLAAARGAATKMRIAVGCAVVDSRGQSVAIQRMDAARFFNVDAAQTLAMNAALSGGPSESASAQNIKNLPKQARIYAIKGGLPLTRSGKVVGAVACHGSTPEQDVDVARAGQTAF
jgi:glc operon protein GlcG